MSIKSADKFFDNVDFVSIVSTIKGVLTSDGTMATLLDFERVLDEADLYAYRNWLLGELVQGPIIGKYTVKCVFMWPYKLMPDPSGAKRLASVGCDVSFVKHKIKVPIEVKNYDDFVQGTRYPKMVERKMWFVEIEMPKELMNEIKEGSIDLSDQIIDLDDLDEAYEDDLDKENTQQDEEQGISDGPDMNMSPLEGAGPPGGLPGVPPT